MYRLRSISSCFAYARRFSSLASRILFTFSRSEVTTFTAARTTASISSPLWAACIARVVARTTVGISSTVTLASEGMGGLDARASIDFFIFSFSSRISSAHLLKVDSASGSSIASVHISAIPSFIVPVTSFAILTWLILNYAEGE